ncbi:MAG: peptidoglycan D,D-transpeptidase FtsI family protein [Patescibacteria group bacterium]
MRNSRLQFLTIVIFILGLLLIGRLFELQVIKFKFYNQRAEMGRKVNRILIAERGRIKDRNGYLLATNVKSYLLYAVPANIKNPKETALAISRLLNISNHTSAKASADEQESEEFKNLVEKLSYRADFYEVLKKDLSEEEAKEIEELNLTGIKVESSLKRYYPEGRIFSHVLGFVGIKNDQPIGQYGLEEFLESDLAGQPGLLRAEQTPSGILILDSEKIVKKPKNGADVVLTLDRFIQYYTCQALEEGIKEVEGESGTAIFMEPQTGKILSLCNWPNFDPNNYQKTKNYRQFFNSAVSESFEPGSVFKVITLAAALDSGNVKPETTYQDTGEVKIGGYTIKNSDLKAHGLKTMTNVLEKSINTGTVFAARKTGLKTFRSYVKNFGFNSLTNIEQAGEAMGDISNLEKSSEIYLATASFGQGISVTPIQILTAIAAIANQGKLLKPYLVDKIIYSDGTILQNQPKFIRQVISPATAVTLSAMMVSVLENGYGKLARVPGYWIAGKTGTAQVANPSGGYSEKIIHSFVGFGPNDNPVFVGLVKINNPKKGRFAESTAAPIFGKIAAYILRYYNIKPNR